MPKTDDSSVQHVDVVTERREEQETRFEPSPIAEKQLLRKLDLVILPWIMLMYFLSYMDRYEICIRGTIERTDAQ